MLERSISPWSQMQLRAIPRDPGLLLKRTYHNSSQRLQEKSRKSTRLALRKE